MSEEQLSLSALLSQVLVALTIEIDNAYESRAPHRTNLLGGSGPWLTSYAMWANFLRLVPDEGISVRELAHRAGWDTVPHPSQAGMERWGYVRVAPEPGVERAKPPKAAWIVRPTAAGRWSASIWETLPDEIEGRWVSRFGASLVGDVRDQATDVVGRLDMRLPAYLPQLGRSAFTEAPSSHQTVSGEPSLVTALANALHAFAIEFERDWPVGLAVGANVLRVIDEAGVAVREVPGRAGISKEAAQWATGVLTRRGSGPARIGRRQPTAGTESLAAVEPDPSASRGKVVRLTPAGVGVRSAQPPRAAAVEDGWLARLGGVAADLRSALEEIVGRDGGAALRAGMEAPAGCWRETARPSAVIPHFPVILHRGAYPDGA